MFLLFWINPGLDKSLNFLLGVCACAHVHVHTFALCMYVNLVHAWLSEEGDVSPGTKIADIGEPPCGWELTLYPLKCRLCLLLCAHCSSTSISHFNVYFLYSNCYWMENDDGYIYWLMEDSLSTTVSNKNFNSYFTQFLIFLYFLTLIFFSHSKTLTVFWSLHVWLGSYS